MLVLTRRTNQSIMIGHDVVVTVLEVRGEQVRLGIQAPREVDVHREEVFEALNKQGDEVGAETVDVSATNVSVEDVSVEPEAGASRARVSET